jgi:hypothetical protein
LGGGRRSRFVDLVRLGRLVVSEGEITELHVGLKGTMNAPFLKDLAAKTYRGIRGGWRKVSPTVASATATRS